MNVEGSYNIRYTLTMFTIQATHINTDDYLFLEAFLMYLR